MARATYGGTITDVLWSPVTIGTTQVAGLPGSQSLQVWNAAGSAQLTDIQDGSGIALPSGLVVTTAAGGIPEFRGPDGHSGPIRLKHPTSGLSWLLPPQTAGGGTSLPNTLVVAASDSGITAADYLCDGTADDVQIAAALTATALNGTIQLSAGTFNLAAVVNVDGADDADVEGDIYIRGAGPSNTTLVVGSGVAAAFNLRKAVRVHICDLGIEVSGASDGIQATYSSTPAAVYRSAWFSSIERVQVKGPWNGTHTGWGLDLGNMFRFRVANVEVGGTGNGIRLENQTAQFNAGDATFDRCFVEVVGTNAVAYSCTSTAGNMNQVYWSSCHSIADPADTGTIGWQFTGAGGTSHMRLTNCNVEQFATTVSANSTAYDLDIGLAHVTVRNGATLFNNAGYDNRFRCGLAYVPPSATVSILTDSNGYTAKPSVYGPISVYGDTNSTLNATVGSTAVLRDIVADGGSGSTIAAQLRRSPAREAPTRAVTLTDAATVTTDAALGNLFDVAMTANRTLGAPTNPVDGQTVVWRVTASGGARTPVLATGAGGFVIATGSPAVTVAAIASGSTAEIEATYSSATARWRVARYSMFTAT